MAKGKKSGLQQEGGGKGWQCEGKHDLGGADRRWAKSHSAAK
jgi:hypothetical protein